MSSKSKPSIGTGVHLDCWKGENRADSMPTEKDVGEDFVFLFINFKHRCHLVRPEQTDDCAVEEDFDCRKTERENGNLQHYCFQHGGEAEYVAEGSANRNWTPRTRLGVWHYDRL